MQNLKYAAQEKNNEIENIKIANKKVIDKLTNELASLKDKQRNIEEELSNVKATNNSPKINNTVQDKKEKELDKNEDLKKNNDYISIDEIYKTTINYTKEPELFVHNNNIKEEEDSFNIGNLEFYNDVIEDKKEEPKVEQNIDNKKTTLVNNQTKKEIANIKHEISLDNVENSLNYLHKKSKQVKTENRVFILGGNRELEDKWKADLEKSLEEYGLEQQWLSNSEKDMLKGLGKGIVFLIAPNSLQYLENYDLITRNTQIPSIKHTITTPVKLKIDIIDNFIRKK